MCALFRLPMSDRRSELANEDRCSLRGVLAGETLAEGGTDGGGRAGG